MNNKNTFKKGGSMAKRKQEIQEYLVMVQLEPEKTKWKPSF